MSLFGFIARSLLTSINVFLRMIVVIIAVAFIFYLVFSFLADYPVAILFVLVIVFFPTLIFIYLSGIRAGLVALRATGPANVKKLGLGVIKLMRFSVMLSNMILTVIGIGGTYALFKFARPDYLARLSEEVSVQALRDPLGLVDLALDIPSGIFPVWALALAVAVGVTGTSSAAIAATAADKGPNHDALWGVTRQFVPLLVLCLVVFMIPALLVVAASGGPLEGLMWLRTVPVVWIAPVLLYIPWTICAVCAGEALAYVRTASDLDREWEEELSGMLGDVVPTDDLRALRLARQERTKHSSE